MERFIIKGGTRLEGNVTISGAKNSALKILSAAIMTDEKVKLYNIPIQTEDIRNKIRMLKSIGVEVVAEDDAVTVDASSINRFDPQIGEGQGLRTSLLLLGVLLGRFGRAKVPWPKGDNFGERKHDLHVYALEMLGAKIKEINGKYLEAESGKLCGTEILLKFPSVGATENSILAACLAEGTSIIRNAAKEPEIVDLACFLNSMGGQIKGAGTDIVVIEGVKKLKGTEFTIIPDRIEACTYIVATAITQGEVLLNNVRFDHMESVTTKLHEIGIGITRSDNGTRINANNFYPTNIITDVYPGFPTDIQPIMTSLLTLAKGKSVIKETVNKGRFGHVSELKKMGAKIDLIDDTMIINGVKELKGTKVIATDIRMGAALAVAGLSAKGETEVMNIYQIDRGYERMEEKLGRLGADIKRIKN